LNRIRAVLFTDPLIILSTIVFGSISLIVSLFDKHGRKQILVARAWSRSLLSISGIRVHVEGLDHVEPDGSYIFASNHASYMDTPVVLANIPVQFRFLAKRELFAIPFLGNHLKTAGHIPVPRDNPREALKTMAEAGRTIRERGISLLIFPEGGRTLHGLEAFKEGAAYIAIKAGAPIVPVGIIGTRAILPRGSIMPVPGHALLRVGEPIPTAHLSLQDRGRLTAELHARVAELLRQTEAPADTAAR
jgi:1-acyl-sn-glycerol-3-phosphate acyltransferase